MNIHITVMIGMILMSVCTVSTQAQDSQEAIRNILLRTGWVGIPGHLESIRAYQRGKNLPDAQIRDVLAKLIAISLAAEDDPLSRQLAGNAIRVISHYGNGGVQGLLSDIIEKNKGSLRHRAIESYMHLVNYSTEGIVTNILSETEKYDDLDRRVVYKQLLNVFETFNEDEKKTVVSLLDNAVIRETQKSNVALLDRFLVNAEKEYANSGRRIAILRKHGPSTRETPTEIDKYFENELSQALEQ